MYRGFHTRRLSDMSFVRSTILQAGLLDKSLGGPMRTFRDIMGKTLVIIVHTLL